MRSLVFGEPRWSGPSAGPVTQAAGLLLSRVLAFVALVVAVLCGWSVVAEPDGRPVAALCLAVFVVLAADLVVSPLQTRHAVTGALGLTLSWWVTDPTSSSGVFPGEIALPCALMTCAGVFAPRRAWGWIGGIAVFTAVLLSVVDHPSVLRLSGLVLQVGMVFATGAVAAALHETVTRTDAAEEQIVAELAEQEVLAERRRAQGEVIDVLHGSVSDALRVVRDGRLEPARTRAECATAYERLRSTARWQQM